MTQQEQDRFSAWLEEIKQRPIPTDRVARIRTFARELAEGVFNEFWGTELDPSVISVSGDHSNFKRFVAQKWSLSNTPTWDLMEVSGFVEQYVDRRFNKEMVRLTREALQLVMQAPRYKVFISYRRVQSSAFALLVLARLKAIGLNPFLDMSLERGGQWRAELQKRIAECEYFILLLGKETLGSPNVLDEIKWAKGKKIIPIWHSGYDLNSSESHVPDDIKEILKETNAIVVSGESALAYNNAIVELLNCFGVTP